MLINFNCRCCHHHTNHHAHCQYYFLHNLLGGFLWEYSHIIIAKNVDWLGNWWFISITKICIKYSTFTYVPEKLCMPWLYIDKAWAKLSLATQDHLQQVTDTPYVCVVSTHLLMCSKFGCKNLFYACVGQPYTI